MTDKTKTIVFGQPSKYSVKDTTTLYEVMLLEIKRYNDIDEPIWNTKLVENMSGLRSEIMYTLGNLIDFGMVEGKYGVTTIGHSGYLYYVTDIGREQLHKMGIQ